MVSLRGPNAVLSRICAFGAGLSMAALFGIIFVNSVRRYTIGKSFEWGEEMPIYLGIYGMMMGAAYAYLQDRHIRFTILVDFVPAAIRHRIFAVVDLLVAASSALLAWSGYLFVTKRGGLEAPGLIGRVRTLAETTGQPWIEVFGHMAFWQASMIVGGVLLMLAALSKFADRVSAPPTRAAGDV
ncbi:TRAP transporter small permease subunit [Breoghania sp. L-A4]|uniref:TRAP transporter small permease n=1 Tax=Breoghania sp. L-A4 TaxID=2304600 RepID=UPI000E35B699|nr:TRAP transporter small permease subunit [Breoghania sp. L-A4]AXS40777.1 TRAP transporter small permease subunit [Breoghania sp. L-A4]